MIYEITGDILLTKASVIAHGVAPFDHFNQGLALSLRENWPAMYKDFRHYCQTSSPEQGEICVWAGADAKQIVHLLTQASSQDHQSNPGKASIEAVNHSLKELKKWAQKNNIQSIAIPKLATGVGGLNWEDVYSLIQKHFSDQETALYVYVQYQKNIIGKEPELSV